jgi:hypothetical protein
MTRGRKLKRGNESIYDTCSVGLFQAFQWSARGELLSDVSDILAVGESRWVFGGAYLWTSASVPPAMSQRLA